MDQHDEAQGTPFEKVPVFEESSEVRYDESKPYPAYCKMYEKFGPVVKEIKEVRPLVKEVGPQVKEVKNEKCAIVNVFNVQDMEKVYKSDGERPERPSHRAVADYRENRPETYSGAGLISNNGECWHKFREMSEKTLMDRDVISQFIGVMEKATEDFMDKIAKEQESKGEVNIVDLVFRWSLEIIGAITLNVQFDSEEEGKELLDAAKNIHKYVHLTENCPDPKGENYGKCVEAQETLERIVKKYMDRAMAEIAEEKHGVSLLSLLLKLKVNGVDVSKEDALTMIVDIFTGGTDTVSVALISMLHNLARHPSEQDTLYQELQEKLKSGTSVGQMPLEDSYVMKVLKESLRMNPTGIGNGRVIPTDLVLGGFSIPAKTTVILQHQVASMQAENFFDPSLFKPSRWNSIKDDNVAHFPLASSPFGGGKRKCIGQDLAERELAIAVSRIIQNFKFSCDHELDTINRLVYVPVGDVILKFERR